jgi:hypothetical protein
MVIAYAARRTTSRSVNAIDANTIIRLGRKQELKRWDCERDNSMRFTESWSASVAKGSRSARE